MRCAVASLLFHYGTGLLVLGNLIVMCLYKPGDTSSRANALHAAELAFAGAFLAEALLRIAASGGQSSCQRSIRRGKGLHSVQGFVAFFIAQAYATLNGLFY